MSEEPLREAEQMLRSGATDECVEQLFEVSLSDIIALRAKLASSPSSPLPGRDQKLERRSRR